MGPFTDSHSPFPPDRLQSAAGTNKTVTEALGYDKMVAALSSGGGGSKGGAIAGAVIGVLAGVALLAGLGYWVYTKRQR